jgi:hypothetical protein
VITEWFIRMARNNAKRPLPTRRSLLVLFTLWSVIALGSALTVGIGIGKTLRHPPFRWLWEMQNWTPFFLLIAGVASAQTLLQRILDGAYRGGEADHSRLEPTQTAERQNPA